MDKEKIAHDLTLAYLYKGDKIVHDGEFIERYKYTRDNFRDALTEKDDLNLTENILQLIPAPPNLYVSWSMSTSPDHKEFALVAAYALMETTKNGITQKAVRAMITMPGWRNLIPMRPTELEVFHDMQFMESPPPEWKLIKDEQGK